MEGLKVGDVVRLASGGPPMTVSGVAGCKSFRLLEDGAVLEIPRGSVEVVWFDRADVDHTAIVPVSTVKLV